MKPAAGAYPRHLDRSRVALQGCLAEVLPQVPKIWAAHPPVDPTLRQDRSDAVEAIARSMSQWIAGVGESLAWWEETGRQEVGAPPVDLETLSIMDDLQVQEEIEIAQTSQSLARDALHALQRLERLEALLRGDAGSQRPSPFGPRALARAFWRATEWLPLAVTARGELVRGVAQLLALRLASLYEDLTDAAAREAGIDLVRLTERTVCDGGRGDGIAPWPVGLAPPGDQGVDRSFRLVEVFNEPGAGFDVTRPGALMILMDSEIAALDDSPRDVEPTKPMLMDGDGARIARMVHRNRARDGRPGQVDSNARRERMLASVFDEILADRALEPEGSERIRALRAALIQLACDDDTLLQSHRHPAWSLVNQLATLYSGPAADRPPNLDAWLDRAIATLRDVPRRESFEAAHKVLKGWRAERMRRRLTEKVYAVDFLRRHAQLASGVRAARQRLRRRLDAGRSDAAVRRFADSVWALVCAQQGARGGDSADPVLDAWDTAVDLIWSTSMARSRRDAPTLIPLIGGLVERLRFGMDGLGIEHAVQDAWLQRLADLHLKALQRPSEEACTDLPLTIDLVLDEAPAAPPGKAGGSAAVDGPHDASAAARLVLETGDSLAIRIRGEWVPLTLFWRSEDGQFLLFERRNGQTLNLPVSSLQRLLDEGMVRLPESSSALARAARRIARRLRTG